MHSGHDQKRMNVEDDRLSNLPDDLIHKILFYTSTKEAIGTSVLASRWRFMWTSLACLSFSSEDFSTLPKFSKFVTHVLSGRNDQIEVSSVKLSFRGKVTQAFVKRLMNYAFSHNVQQMTVECLEKKIEFPLSVFKSQSLKSLSLIGLGGYRQTITSIPTWELSALTTLHLDRITFCDDNLDNFVGLFSKFINLKSLTLKHYNVMGFSISHPKLCTLTLEYGDEVVNVVAPQLKNLSLTLLQNFPNFPNGLPTLEKVDLCIDHPCKADTQEYVRLLQQVHSVKSLTLNLEVIEVLSSSVELFMNHPFTFDNLKILRIYPFDIYLVQQAQMKEKVSAVVKNYFLDSSPSATMTMASRELCCISTISSWCKEEFIFAYGFLKFYGSCENSGRLELQGTLHWHHIHRSKLFTRTSFVIFSSVQFNTQILARATWNAFGAKKEGEAMDFGPNRTRINVQGDRLSSLPDDLIFKILAYHDTKFAVRTSALSSRWKSTWKSMSYLSFSSDDFTTLPKLSQFITHVLSHRNNQIDVSSLKLSFRGKVNQPFVKKVINYALSHNVQKISVTCLEFPLSLFSSQSLKDLTLIRRISDQSVTLTSNPIIPTSTWELPALSTLHLDHVTFNTDNSEERGGIFAACKNLKSLTLTDCNITGSNDCFTIGHNKLNSLEKADLYIGDPGKIDAIKIVDMFRKFHNVKFLTLGLEIVEIYPEKVLMKGQEEGKVTVYIEVMKYLLRRSPSAILAIFSREEVRAMKNTESAKFHMEELRMLLDQEKEKEKNANVKRVKAPTGPKNKPMMQPAQAKAQLVEHQRPLISSQIQSCWDELNKHLNAQIQYGKAKIDPIISKMQCIEELLRELPASNRANMQESFSSLCTEANAIMKWNCNSKESRLRNCYHELTKTSQS